MKENTNNPSGAGSILVTGANGQLGSELQQLAAFYPQYNFIFLSREHLSIHEVEEVRHSFKQYAPEYCVNCAAYTAVDKAETEKEMAFRVNAEATGILAAVCKEYGCTFIHISTDYVFDGTATTPYKVDSPTNPQNVYGASKLEGERLALQNNPDSIVIRTSWVYSEFGRNFVKTMLRLMSEKKEISVVNDQQGSPTYAADLAKAILQIIESIPALRSPLSALRSPLPAHGIFHYSNAGIITWYDFAIAIKELSGSNCKVNPVPASEYPTPAKRPSWSVMDTSKIRQTFGVEPRDWRQALEECIQKINKTGK